MRVIITKVTVGCLLYGLLGYALLDACGLDWRVPANHFDGVDSNGCVEYWENASDIDFGDGLKVPISIGFRSKVEDGAPSPYLGCGWVLPLLESNIVQTGDDSFMMLQPDGWSNLFLRGERDGTVLNGSAGWKAEIKGDAITAWAPCGWKLEFNKGRIISITTPTNRKLKYIYTNHVATAIEENGVQKLSVGRDVFGALNTLIIDGLKIGINLGSKPIVKSFGGQNVVTGTAQSLNHFDYNDGAQNKRETYNFVVDDKIHANLKISAPGMPIRTLTWDPKSKLIITDDRWHYAIGKPFQEGGVTSIKRTNDSNQSESWFRDGPNGVEVMKSLSGETYKRTWFTSGVMAGKIRSIETTDSNGKICKERMSYNSDGSLFREARYFGAHEILTTYIRHLDGAPEISPSEVPVGSKSMPGIIVKTGTKTISYFLNLKTKQLIIDEN